MDGESLINAEDYAEIVRQRDEALRELERQSRPAIDLLDMWTTEGNRRQRKLAAAKRKGVEQKIETFRRRIHALFERLTKGFDPSVGTLGDVQAEAAAALCDILG